LKKNLADSLLQEKKRSIDLKNESELLETIVSQTKFGELPETIIDNESRSMLAELEQSVLRQGGNLRTIYHILKRLKKN
jgi:FKBP-type peptidyl-prolyl cis-trans isomerase (trigger factor)